ELGATLLAAPRRCNTARLLWREWNYAWEHIRLQQRHQADECGPHDREPEHAPEDGSEHAEAFGGALIAGGNRNSDRLRVDNLAHHAAGRVGGGGEDGVQMQLLGSYALKASEQRIRGRVRPGQKHA